MKNSDDVLSAADHIVESLEGSPEEWSITGDYFKRLEHESGIVFDISEPWFFLASHRCSTVPVRLSMIGKWRVRRAILNWMKMEAVDKLANR